MVITDGAEIRSTIISAIREAKLTIDLAVAYFTDLSIAKSLELAIERGVVVRVVISNSPINDTVLSEFSDNIKFRVYDSSLMHQKYLITDSLKVINGSYNYTNAAHYKNKEVVTVSKEGKEFLSEFNKIYMESNEYNKSPLKTVNVKDPVEFNDSLEDMLSGILKSNLVQFNVQEVEEEGNNDAKSAQGSKDIFITRVNQYFQDFRQSLSSNSAKIEQIKSHLDAAGQQVKDKVISRRDGELDALDNSKAVEESNHLLEIEKLNNRKNTLSEEKQGVKLRLDSLKLRFDQNEEEIEVTNEEIGLIPFWRFNTIIKLICLLLLSVILSCFFASTMYNILAAKDIAYELLGYDETFVAQPIYFDITRKLQETFGMPGLFAFLVFLIPVTFTLVKVVKPDINKLGEILFGWIIGVFIIDLFVSIRVSSIQHEIDYIFNTQIGEFRVWDAILSGEVVVVFILGAFPLMLVKILGESINNSFLASSAFSIDKYKAIRLSSLKKERNKLNRQMSPLVASIESIELKIQEVLNELDAEHNRMQQTLHRFDSEKNVVHATYDDKLVKVDESVGRYTTMLQTGDKSMLKQGLEGKIATYRTGYFQWITSYFSQAVSETKIGKIESALDGWYKQNMV